ncbi:MAG: hypothetical protein KatS3mg059_1525 [Thermomicrobiales bacterium]|nr:MAG: hypothetical protein KatS3mg059_1525 [Thermomicrobiales bacterium]
MTRSSLHASPLSFVQQTLGADWAPGQIRHAPRVISASKRTDIPAFHLPWLVERVKEGWVSVRNPFFYRASDPERYAIRVSLRPEDVAGIVWWSKNYGVYLRPRFYRCFEIYERQHFQFTINPRGERYTWLEPDVPDLDEALRQVRELAQRRGPSAISWRYDPLVFWNDGVCDHSTWDPEFFSRMCDELGAAGVTVCITSIVDPYKKFLLRLGRLYPHISLREPSENELDAIVGEMMEIAQQHGIAVQACSEPLLERYADLRPAHCINGALFGATTAAATDQRMKGRETCGCTRHTDIGDYERQECGYACLYCYANPNHRRFATLAQQRGKGAEE